MKVGDIIRVLRCEACESVVGKSGKVRCFKEDDTNMVSVSFGKGRPQVGRPYFFPVSDLEVIAEARHETAHA